MKRTLAWPCLVVTVTLGLAGGACGGRSGDGSCAYWTEELKKGAKLEAALHRVTALKCKEALPVMTDFFKSGQLQDAVFTAIRGIGDREGSVEILRYALTVPALAKPAADLVSEWKLKQAKPELLKVMTDPTLASARGGALPALLEFEGAAAIEGTLLQAAVADANEQAIIVNARAIEELGKLKSQKAGPVLVKAAFLRTNKGFEVYRQVRAALARIGDPKANDLLLQVLAGTNEELRAYAKSQNNADWETRDGYKVTQLLVDSLDPRVLGPLVEHLARDLEQPADLDDQAFERWRVAQVNRLKLVSFAVGHFGDASVVASLAAILKDEKKDAGNQRMNAAAALAGYGGEDAQDALIEAWANDTMEFFKAPLLPLVALAIDDRRLVAYDAMLGVIPEGQPKPKKPVELSAEVQKEIQENKQLAAYVQVVRDCKDDAACYVKKLKSTNPDEQAKAALVFARGRFPVTPEIKTALIDTFKNAAPGSIDAKRYVLMALTRVGDASDGEKVGALIPELSGRDAVYWKEELTAVSAALGRRAPPSK
jgi:hypothetical protein